MNGDLARTLMEDFADSTGILSGTPRRYLWTDAFAVCNFLGLSRHGGEKDDRRIAVRLVDQVHQILGRHRDDDPRRGWISGLPDEEGKLHPTRAGLRIGKPLNEQAPDQPADPATEWDRDGQYFHYLTKWMHALNRMAQETEEEPYHRWAVELAVKAHEAFTYEVSPGGPKRMFWKMSIDLTRPLVSSMGHHDPLDGLVTFLELQTAERRKAEPENDLRQAIADMTEMCEGTRWATGDPLGIGGLLDAASRLAPLAFQRGAGHRDLLHRLLADADLSLKHFAPSFPASQSAERRLAFRELGLSIGLHGLERVRPLIEREHEFASAVNELLTYQPLAEQIERFWSDPAHRQSRTWRDHRDINTVMLATRLAPDGYVPL